MIRKALTFAKRLGLFYLIFGSGFVIGNVYQATLLVSWKFIS
ncbi:MAG TPA: hypothetical protein VFJ46_17715 [Xanthobacteraceae bacterium]|nr:hypothetical protein [Xanthobacteraceae bacterium]